MHVHKYLGDWESQWNTYAGAYTSTNVILKNQIIGSLPPGISKMLIFWSVFKLPKKPQATNQQIKLNSKSRDKE